MGESITQEALPPLLHRAKQPQRVRGGSLQPRTEVRGGLLASVQQYFSDGLEAYRSLHYRQAQHTVAPGKSQTYSVEAVNADLRHYLARLGRRSRCFTRSGAALVERL